MNNSNRPTSLFLFLEIHSYSSVSPSLTLAELLKEELDKRERDLRGICVIDTTGEEVF